MVLVTGTRVYLSGPFILIPRRGPLMATQMLRDEAPEPTDRQTIIAYKGSPEFAVWLTDLADHVGIPVTMAVDFALKGYAETVGFRDPPSRLSPRSRRRHTSSRAMRAR